MYNEYFGFSEAPFSIAPDPRYLFMSERHREALAHLLYGLKVDGGFVLLTGEVGTGKTTICRCLLEQVPENCDIAFIINPKLNAGELLRTLCEELHIDVPSGTRGLKSLVDLLNLHLLETNARGRKTVLIVDEAQNLSNDVLEHLRLLTNLETNQRKLLQIILLGQPELRERLAEPGMRQLAQRIVARYHLEPLSRPELSAYVEHRLAVAGGRHTLFPARVLDRLYRLSGGTPRLINVICDRALLGTWAEGRTTINRATLDRAAREVLGPLPDSRSPRPMARRIATAALLVGLFAGIAGFAISYPHLLPGPMLQTLVQAPGDRLAVTEGTKSPVLGHTGEGPAAVAAGAAGTLPVPAESADTIFPPPGPAADPVASLVLPGGGSGSGPDSRGPENASENASADGVSAEIAWPSDIDHWLHEALAVRALFQLWRIDVQPAGVDAACAVALERGLQCLSRRDDLREAGALGGPAILELRQAGGPNFFATLFDLDGERAHLVVGTELRELSVERLRAQWTGAYTLLWRAPPGGGRLLSIGARGADVAWVDRHLARWEGNSSGEAGSLFTAAMAERVRGFQRAHGLADDGIAGPMTLVRLAAYADGDIPILGKRSE